MNSNKIDISVLKEFFFKSRLGKLILVVVLLSLFYISFGNYVYSKYQEYKWGESEYFGEMEWTDANEKCKSLGMRLPTIDELRAAYKLRITKSWEDVADSYWSSTPSDTEFYHYLLVIRSGVTNAGPPDISLDVRCLR